MLITGERGSGKTSLMIYLRNKYINKGESKPAFFKNFSHVQKSYSDELYLFYFLKPGDYLINMIIDITHKMRLKYLKKGNFIDICCI